jgi:hypothetical protein
VSRLRFEPSTTLINTSVDCYRYATLLGWGGFTANVTRPVRSKAMHLIQGVEVVHTCTVAVFPGSRFQYADQLFASVMRDHQYDCLETKASKRALGKSARLKSTLKNFPRGLCIDYFSIETILRQ